MEQKLTITEIQKQLHDLKIKIGLMNKDYAKSDGGNRGADFKTIQAAKVQRVDLEGQLTRAQNANSKARQFIGPVSTPKQAKPIQSLLDSNSIFSKPKQKVSSPPLQYIPNIQDMSSNPKKYAADWNKKQAQDAEWAKKNPTKPATYGKVHLMVDEGNSLEARGIGHSWIKVTWSNGKEETIELQPQGAFLGGAPDEDALINHQDLDGLKTLNRKYDNELTFQFDERKWKNIGSMKDSVANRNWTIFNNCTDFPIEVIKNVVGKDFGEFGPETPRTLSRRMYLYKHKNNIRSQPKQKF